MNNIEKCTKPSVGIWWFYYDDVLFADPVEVEKGLPYGECITGLSDHADFWDKLEAAGELKKIPNFLRSEYFHIPRGRVVFHKEGKEINITINIGAFFALTKTRNKNTNAAVGILLRATIIGLRIVLNDLKCPANIPNSIANAKEIIKPMIIR